MDESELHGDGWRKTSDSRLSDAKDRLKNELESTKKVRSGSIGAISR